MGKTYEPPCSNHDEDEDFTVNDASDCFEDQSTPLYGWSVEIPRIIDESCNIEPSSGQACGAVDKIFSKNSSLISNLNLNNIDRQVNEEFVSVSAPTCRIRRFC